MIPKIAWFHWSQNGRTMPWIRMVSIMSFMKFNPDWDIRILSTYPDIANKGLMLGNEADWSWWRTLAKHGGFQVSSDIVFVKPIPEEWMDCDLNVCTNGQGYLYQFAMLGCIPGHRFLVAAEKECERLVESGETIEYQTMGAVNLRKFSPCIFEKSRTYHQPREALCNIDWLEAEQGRFWREEPIPTPDYVIGVHWFGGAETTKQMDSKATPESNYSICKLAKEVLSGREAMWARSKAEV